MNINRTDQTISVSPHINANDLGRDHVRQALDLLPGHICNDGFCPEQTLEKDMAVFELPDKTTGRLRHAQGVFLPRGTSFPH